MLQNILINCQTSVIFETVFLPCGEIPTPWKLTFFHCCILPDFLNFQFWTICTYNYMYRYQSKVHKYIYSLRSSCIAGQTQSLKIIKTSHETDRKYSSEQLVMVANAILRQIFRFQNTDCCNVHLILLSVFKYCRMILSYHILIILHCALNI